MEYRKMIHNLKINIFDYNKTGCFCKKKESLQFSGEGIGNPLQYSCLENPVDGGA